MTLLNYKNQDHYESKVTQKETQLVLMTRGCGGKKKTKYIRKYWCTVLSLS